MAIALGTNFGRYEMASLIGAGGKLARDAKINRDVAIKSSPLLSFQTSD